MKIAMVNHSDINGGAARAAWRIHHALRQSGVDSQMYVNRASAGDWTVTGPQGKLAKALGMLRSPLGGMTTRLLKTGNPILHSPAILPSSWPKRLNGSDADIVHLHWINGEMMSIADIGRITKPVVWTLHDMWALCGAEHCADDFRWRDGYLKTNRPPHESGFDLNRWTWQRKIKAWKKPVHIVTPSRWLADCARQSMLMRDWPISVIPNALDTDVWQPVEKKLARQLMNLPIDCHLLAFGAFGAVRAPHKGFDLLLSALEHLRGQMPDLHLVVFGENEPKQKPDLGFPIHFVGHLHDDLSLRVLYSAADAMMIPSRIDNLPNAGVEAIACGTPVIAFDTCGLSDIVTHQQTGWLAKAFDTEDLARGIQWILGDENRYDELQKNAREYSVRNFSSPRIVNQYLECYYKIITP